MSEVLEERYNFDTLLCDLQHPSTSTFCTGMSHVTSRLTRPLLFYKICSTFLMELFISSSSFFFHIVALLAYQVLVRCMPRCEKDQQSSLTGHVSDNSIIIRFPYNVVDTAIVNSILLFEQLNPDTKMSHLDFTLLSHVDWYSCLVNVVLCHSRFFPLLHLLLLLLLLLNCCL